MIGNVANAGACLVLAVLLSACGSSVRLMYSGFQPLEPAPTFRDRFPEVVFQYVAIHEIGHYVGLNHDGHTSPAEIMWKPALGTNWGETIGNYGFGSGEANFTRADAEAVWQWITTTPEALDKIFP